MMNVPKDEALRKLRIWWFDKDMTRKDMCKALGIGLTSLTQLVHEADLPDRRGREFKRRMEVMIRGERFKDVPEAAARFDVHETTVFQAVSAGTPDSIGVGIGRYKRTKPSHWRKPLSVGPFTWPTQEQGAAALGISYGRLRQIHRTGRTDILIARAMALEARLAKEGTAA